MIMANIAKHFSIFVTAYISPYPVLVIVVNENETAAIYTFIAESRSVLDSKRSQVS